MANPSTWNVNFSFGSPHNPRLDKTVCFERFWPNRRNTDAFRIEKLTESGNEAFVLNEFGRIKAKGIAWRSLPHGEADRKVNTAHGGRIVYWDQPDGHVWEILTESYARRPG